MGGSAQLCILEAGSHDAEIHVIDNICWGFYFVKDGLLSGWACSRASSDHDSFEIAGAETSIRYRYAAAVRRAVAHI